MALQCYTGVRHENRANWCEERTHLQNQVIREKSILSQRKVWNGIYINYTPSALNKHSPISALGCNQSFLRCNCAAPIADSQYSQRSFCTFRTTKFLKPQKKWIVLSCYLQQKPMIKEGWVKLSAKMRTGKYSLTYQKDSFWKTGTISWN